MMSEEKRHTDIEGLIARHLAGTATPQEEAALQGWLEADNRHREEVEQLQRLWQEAEQIGALAHPDLDREWEALRRQLHIQPHGRPALQVVHHKRMTTRMLRIAAILIIGLFAAALIHMITGPLTHKIYTATASIEVITLPDGTLLHLDRGSRLVTPRRFNKNGREVTLQGVAWFEVEHDAARPFTVHAGNVDITVLGTRFSVRADDKEKTVVDLVEGSVKVSSPRDGEALLLAPGEEACWDRKEKELTKTAISDPNFLAWKTRHLVFDATPLQQVVETLAKTYHVQFINAGNTLLNCRVTASFDNDSLEDVLSTLTEILDVTFTPGDKGYIVHSHGCKE